MHWILQQIFGVLRVMFIGPIPLLILVVANANFVESFYTKKKKVAIIWFLVMAALLTYFYILTK